MITLISADQIFVVIGYMQVYRVIEILHIVPLLQFKEVESRNVPRHRISGEGEELCVLRELGHEELVVVVGVHEEYVVVLIVGRRGVQVLCQVFVLSSCWVPEIRYTETRSDNFSSSSYLR